MAKKEKKPKDAKEAEAPEGAEGVEGEAPAKKKPASLSLACEGTSPWPRPRPPIRPTA